MDNPLLLGGTGFAITIALIILEVPVAVAMGLVGLLGCAWLIGGDAIISIGSTTTWDSLTNYTLSVLPLFVLMGNLASRSGLSSRLYQSARTLVGHYKGGLALATMGACGGFGMISGSSLATAATMGRIAVPEMLEANYTKSLASGTVAAGSTLGILIPPSTILVIYAYLAEQSIKSLFMAALVPSVLAFALYCVAVYLPIMLGWVSAPSVERSSFRQRLAAVLDVGPIVVIFVLIIGLLYSGFLTANETAAIGVGLVLLYGVFSRRLSFENLLGAAADTARTCGALYLVVIGANLFNFFLALTGVPFTITTLLDGFVSNPLLLIIVMTIIYLVLGCLMDSLAMVLLTVPLFVPIVQAAGIDPIWFGIYVVMVVELGLITPPVGMNLFVIRASHEGLRLHEVWKGIIPFIIVDLIRVALIVAFPMLVLWLPLKAL